MKTKRTVRSRIATPAEVLQPPKEVRNQVSGETIGKALLSARVPYRYSKPNVKLLTFEWGARMRNWLDKVVLTAEAKGKSFFVHSTENEVMDASAMLVRTLVMRGFDAIWCSLDELVGSEEILRRADFIVIAGFYSKEFDTAKGCPLTPAQSHALSWKLWRASSDGVSIIGVVSPSSADAGRWWTNGALLGIFNNTQSLKLKSNSI